MIRFSFYRLLVIGVIICSNPFLSNIYAEERICDIVITEPQDNAAVGREIIVKGKANIPRGSYLWVLARRNDFKPLWWPQREAEIDPRTKKWSATAVFGVAQDVGWTFDIGVIAVDKSGHSFLKNYWLKAMRTGDWRPIEIPETQCPPKIIKVKKTNH